MDQWHAFNVIVSTRNCSNEEGLGAYSRVGGVKIKNNCNWTTHAIAKLVEINQ